MQPMNRMQSGYFPPAPTGGMSATSSTGMNPSFSLFSRLQSPAGQNTNKRQKLVKDLEAMIMGQGPAQNVGQGIGQLMSGVALGVARRNAAFPEAPGGAAPSFKTGLMNFFTGGHNGGLF